jgi:hypothetical protein
MLLVTDVRRGAIGAQLAEQPQHLVSLTSIQDDALGEELQVSSVLRSLDRIIESYPDLGISYLESAE